MLSWEKEYENQRDKGHTWDDIESTKFVDEEHELDYEFSILEQNEEDNINTCHRCGNPIKYGISCELCLDDLAKEIEIEDEDMPF